MLHSFDEEEIEFSDDFKEEVPVDLLTKPTSLPDKPTSLELEIYGCTYAIYINEDKKNFSTVEVGELKDFIAVNFEKGIPKSELGNLVTKIVAISRHKTPQRHILYEKEKKEKNTGRILQKHWWRD